MIYLDTSVVVGLFLPEARTESIAACNDTLVATDCIVAEFASALSLKERRGDLTAEGARAAWEEFRLFCRTGLRLVPASREAFGVAATLVRDEASGLRAGDALHLAVALEIGASAIATGDDVLEANARCRGISVVRF
jgi:predicted nucleic acid-binding protein